MAWQTYQVNAPVADQTEGRDQDRFSMQGELASMEASYLTSVSAFLHETSVTELEIRSPGLYGRLETETNSREQLQALFGADLEQFFDGAAVPVSTALALLAIMLRDEGLGLSLESAERIVIEVGWDRTIYVGSSMPCVEAVAVTREAGLLCEIVPTSPVTIDTTDVIRDSADETFWRTLDDLIRTQGDVLLEVQHLRGAGNSKLFALNRDDIPSARSTAELQPRSLCSVWPGLLVSVPSVLQSVEPDQTGRLIWRTADGHVAECTIPWDEHSRVEEILRDAEAALWLPWRDGDAPLFSAVLPDRDGVVRARWPR